MPELGTNLDLTIATLQQDLTTVSASDAIAIIENWEEHFQGHDLGEDLAQLKRAINSGDKQVIAEILTEVGEDTTDESASRSVDEFEAKIKQLGNLLIEVGNSLKS
ncbi:MAG: hypothetical protein JOZ78_13795 [Chroococcidiopsidaceae cyanobacterium CP_BM_ER_R8_30]|nr:hypothetical protein [Chroococcidiopsidaceae cyanobacterium CP_BM_ER_R8_30]